MFGTRWAELKVRLTELELRMDHLAKGYRSLEAEWSSAASRYDAIVKRAQRLYTLETKEKQPGNSEFHVEQPELLSDEQIVAEYYRQGGK